MFEMFMLQRESQTDNVILKDVNNGVKTGQASKIVDRFF